MASKSYSIYLIHSDASNPIALIGSCLSSVDRQVASVSSTLQPSDTITVSYTNGGELWGVGDTKRIQWSSNGTFTSFNSHRKSIRKNLGITSSSSSLGTYLSSLEQAYITIFSLLLIFISGYRRV